MPRTVYGNRYSENGWPMINANECDRGKVPGTDLVLPIAAGDANTILKGWCSWFHFNVESLNNRRGFTDEGAWTLINDVGNSNHLSGTAVDLNWSEHAFRVSMSGFTQTEQAQTRRGLHLFEGTIFWGQDWRSPKDAMHFQIGLAPGNPKIADFAKRLRAGHLGIWKGTQTPLPPPKPAPQAGKPLLQIGTFGPTVAKLQANLNRVFPSYRAMPLAVDGDFGPMTASAVREFQERDGQAGAADGIVGDQTWARLAVYGIKP